MDNNSTNNSNPYQERAAKHLLWAKRMVYLFAAGFGLLMLMFIILAFYLPSFEQLENPRSRIASEIYTSDGKLLGKFYIENRTPVPYDSLSPYLVQALISTEDARFYQHSGIDPEALARVFVKTFLLQQRNSGGGSTISQQLAKLLVGRPNTKNMNFVHRLFTLGTTKLKEWLTAVKLERAYTKEEIISLYFNEFDFLYGANGIKSASEIYFDKHPSKLDINEAATLVRMLKNPSLFNPKTQMKRAMEGKAQVLKNMQNKGYISQGEYEQYKDKAIDLSRFRTRDHNDGLGTHFREHLRDHLKELLQRKDLRRSDGKPYDVYTDGLKIYTTIDSAMQAHAEQAVWDHLSKHQEKMFEHWPNWNNKNPKATDQNPWTYKVYGTTPEELELRQQSLLKLVWESERYQAMRPTLMPTATEKELRDIDLYRIQKLKEANRNPQKGKKGEVKDGEYILKEWLASGFVTQELGVKYREVLNSDVWVRLEKELEAMMDMMRKPVQMTVFAYNKKGEKDTTMSPYDSILYHRMHLQTGMMALDPRTGEIKAWVGGLNHKFFKYDHVNTRANRQVGSSIKPFLYGLTVDQRGYSPCYKVYDRATTIGPGDGNFGLMRAWTPRNASGGYSGAEMTLTQALRLSLNSVSAQLMKDLGSTAPFRNFLREIGFDTAKIPNSPTICLGSADLSVFEMTGGFAIFATGGYYRQPIFIDRIETRTGSVIYSSAQDQRIEQVMGEQGAFVMNQMLQGAQQGAPGFQGIKSKYGGKTGTTNFQSDGWFMGITPNVVVGTWVGCDDRFIRFRTLAYGQGAAMARPIFQNFLRYVEQDKNLAFNTKADYPVPENISKEMNCLRYLPYDSPADELMDYTTDPNYFDDYDEDDGKKKKDKEKEKTDKPKAVLPQGEG
jgi:penicillin-binding protein 1A